jgi:beta-glucosidase
MQPQRHRDAEEAAETKPNECIFVFSAVLGILCASAVAFGSATRPATQPSPIPLTQNTPPITEPADVAAIKLGKDGNVSAEFLNKHQSFLGRRSQGPIRVLFLGDSITDFWRWPGPNGGKEIWDRRYAMLDAANFGMSGDRTQHVLWRIANGELDGIHPQVVVLLIGANNLAYPLDEIERGQKKIIDQIHQKLPDTKLLLMGVFPRGGDPQSVAMDAKMEMTVAAMREKIKADNQFLAGLGDGDKTRFLDVGDKFLDSDGKIPTDIMPDGLHLDARGYQIWADAMQPLLDEMLK